MRLKNKNNIWGVTVLSGKPEYWKDGINSEAVQKSIGYFIGGYVNDNDYCYVDLKYLVPYKLSGRKLLFYGCAEAVKVAKRESERSSVWTYEAKKYEI
jgi:hypothetical protein